MSFKYQLNSHKTTLMTAGYTRLLSLGYEASDMCLRRLARSLPCGLTSTAVWPVVGCGGVYLPRLSLFRCVPFTDRFTETVSELLPSPISWPRAELRITSVF